MRAKETRVTLEARGSGARRDFELAHAERILRLPRGGGWMLPGDSGFTFDTRHGIRRSADKDGDQGGT